MYLLRLLRWLSRLQLLELLLVAGLRCQLARGARIGGGARIGAGAQLVGHSNRWNVIAMAYGWHVIAMPWLCDRHAMAYGRSALMRFVSEP